ncbi:tenecin-1-like [Diabrotica virgifera virgifera]|uniref:Tenecin-1-like n=1 Tax=Diabrotica virgifera virgifera TaxID=50390 RepID=A0A6P7H713_DIAVI|nr:tenecin-1-like [Diabrotica virgifera virgifera]
MKCVLFSIFLFAIVASINSSPIGQEQPKVDEPDVLIPEDYNPEQKEEHSRVKRFTCDVLSVEAKGVKLNDAACAIRCLTLGKAGGWCDRHKVCNCRK